MLKELHRRRDEALHSLEATRFRATTAGPLTLHLARASALENAGIHLHPLYGFCCLPASGIKGMARAWAETVWLADQEDRTRAWRLVRQAFGWSPGSERGKTRRPRNVEEADDARAGDVVFHDAWPIQWPRLEVDITNNHHPAYYEGDDEPGDWEDPRPVSFLAVPAGVEFDFAVSGRRAGGRDDGELLELARDWIAGALCHAGAGAKTNAGYGRFRLVDWPRDLPEPPRPRQARTSSAHRLTLATPAFLAGARQAEADCVLRPATVRGLLRWWWRTMHSGHLARADLRRLEAAVWGSAETGGALALTVGEGQNATPKFFNVKQGYQIKPEFAQEHGIQRPVKKTIQGLFYASYGMDEKGKRRWYVDSGASWTVTLTARDTVLQAAKGKDNVRLSARQVLRQGEAALWLLCQLGGVGSKARKGFGSFRDLPMDDIKDIEACKSEAQALREESGLHRGRCADAPQLERMMPLERTTEWTDAWFAVDKVGEIYQAVVKSFGGGEDTSKSDRLALGLPRRLGKPPRPLQAGRIKRHSSPIHWSLSRKDDGKFLVRFTAFPAPRLPEAKNSQRVLEIARKQAEQALNRQAGTKPREKPAGTRSGSPHSGRGRRAAGPAPPANPAFHTPRPTGEGLPRPGERVDCVLLEEKTKKGGWKAKHVASGTLGPIQNSADVPENAQPGQTVLLVVQYARPGDAAFRWPPPNDPKPGKPKKAGPPRRGRRR